MSLKNLTLCSDSRQSISFKFCISLKLCNFRTQFFIFQCARFSISDEHLETVRFYVYIFIITLHLLSSKINE